LKEKSRHDLLAINSLDYPFDDRPLVFQLLFGGKTPYSLTFETSGVADLDRWETEIKTKIAALALCTLLIHLYLLIFSLQMILMSYL
jgi:hypothetical protein